MGEGVKLNLFLSPQWVGVLVELWKLMKAKERFLFFLNLTAPIINRIAFLASFGVALRVVVSAANGDISSPWDKRLGVGLFLVFVFSWLLQFLAEKTTHRYKGGTTRLVRRILARQLVFLREVPDSKKVKLLERFHRVEPGFVSRSAAVLNQTTDILGSIILVSVLLVLITIMVPLLGGIISFLAIVVVFVLRQKVAQRVDLSSGELNESRVELKELAKELAYGKTSVSEITHEYECNSYDELRRQPKDKIFRFRIIMGAGISLTASLLLLFVYWVALSGTFNRYDPIFLVLFAFALRFVIMQSRSIMTNLFLLLNERDTISSLRKMLGDNPELPGVGLNSVSVLQSNPFDSDES